MTQIGEVALWIALLLTAWGAYTAFWGGRRGRGDLVLSAERALQAVFALTVIAAVALWAAFLGNEFQYRYVAGYSNLELATYYKITALWAGHAGSLVLWILMLSLFGALVVRTNRRSNREFMPYVAGTLHSVLLFFLVVILFTSNPFDTLSFTPADGRGMNPQLQNFWMIAHPPTLYLGFTAFTVPFAFAIAALFSGRLDSRWIVITRRWTLVAWFFLTIGIVMGMIWAYETLGWGGYWFWDPVENASLLPWLFGTAFLHSVMIQEKRGMLKVWNMFLVLGTFLLTIFATFLTRSGLIESVHTFAQNLTISYVFLAYMSVLTVICAGLVWWRRDRMEPGDQIESFVSREAAFLLNNLIFVGLMFAVMWGTMFPLISEGFTGQTIGVGPPFFDRVAIPLGLVLLALMGIGPVIAWRKASPRNLRKNFVWPVAVAVLVAVAFAMAGARHVYVLLTFALGAFTLTAILIEFGKGTRARARIAGVGRPRAFFELVGRNRRRYGGYIVHMGVVVMFMGFAGSAYDVEEQIPAEPGERFEVRSPFGHTYQMTYQGMSWYPATNMTKLVASIRLFRDGRDLGMVTAEQRAYRRRDETISVVGIRRAWNEDLYVILAGIDDPNGVIRGTNPEPLVTFRILVNPLVPWIWIGALIVAGGTVIAFWPAQRSGAGASGSARPPGRREDEKERDPRELAEVG